MGLTIVISMSLLTIGGITARMILEKSKWNTVLAMRIKLGHKIFGCLVIFLAQINIILGGISYADRGHPLAKTLVIVETVVFFILVIAFEVMFQIYKKKEQPFREINDVMTREDFDTRIRGGEKLCILDDMVLNVESFRADHPGGQFLIDFHVGRDVSKFFYGGYVLENQSGMSPYTHSNVARSIVNSLAIAKLIAQSETLQGVISSSHVINKSTKVFTL